MSTAQSSSGFIRTTTLLFGRGSGAAVLMIALGALLLGAWVAWATLARVGVYAVSQAARLEVDQTAHAVQVIVPGRVAISHVALNRAVHAGDVLLVLDDNAPRLELREQQARRAAIEAQLPPLRRQLATLRTARAQLQPLSRASRSELRARLREARSRARHAERRASRLEAMDSSHLVSAFEVQDARAEAERIREEADAARGALARVGYDETHRSTEAQAEVDRLEREEAGLAADVATASAAIERLENEVSLRTIRAPVDGYVGETSVLRVGSFVQAGERVATIVPAGRVHVVAEYAAADVGRIRIGQRAKMRLDSFPWTEYGTVDARVTGVADVVNNGVVRVELAVQPDPRSRIPPRHGLTGTVEIEVERTSPLDLVVRTIGQRLRPPAPEPPAQTAPALAPR